MSLQACNGTIGFPIKVSQNIFDQWSNGGDMNTLIAPIDFSIAWASSNRAYDVNVLVTDSTFNINLGDVASYTTLTYGTNTTYSCSPNISLIQIQHGALSSVKNATQELIMSFTINNKARSPSSPDVILFCRPVVLVGSNKAGGFWPNVNRAAKGKPVRGGMNVSDIQSIYAYNSETLMPMLTYDTCINSQIRGSRRTPLKGSIHVRVHVVPQPLYIPSDDSGTGKCTNKTKYEFSSRIINAFDKQGYDTLQFNTGLNKFPGHDYSHLVALSPTAKVSTWEDVVKVFEYLVPEAFLGKSLADINKATKITAPPKANKQYKCYKIDPQKDIQGNKILIDPMTGESLEDAQRRSLLESSGGDAQLALGLAGSPPGEPGLSPGDIEEVVLIILSVIGGTFLIIYMYHIFNLFKNGDPDVYKHILTFVGLFLILFAATWALSRDKKPGR